MKCNLHFNASHKSAFQIIHKSYCDCVAVVKSEQISQACLKALIFIVIQTIYRDDILHYKKKLSVRY